MEVSLLGDRGTKNVPINIVYCSDRDAACFLDLFRSIYRDQCLFIRDVSELSREDLSVQERSREFLIVDLTRSWQSVRWPLQAIRERTDAFEIVSAWIFTNEDPEVRRSTLWDQFYQVSRSDGRRTELVRLLD